MPWREVALDALVFQVAATYNYGAMGEDRSEHVLWIVKYSARQRPVCTKEGGVQSGVRYGCD